jgi:AdoMet-dependent heme synthase
MPRVDFAQAPFLVIWETTQACDLTCVHCRASAQPVRDPHELTTGEGKALLDSIAGLGTPLVVLSGGDPSNRPDLPDLIAHAKGLGLRAATIPAATDKLTRERVRELKAAGLDQLAVSIDLPTAEGHDAFRGVPGAFAKSLKAVEWAHEADLPIQVNTTLCGSSAPHLEEMARFVTSLGIVFWEVFFLVPLGRGVLLPGLSAAECERLFAVIYDVQKHNDFIVKVTEAPHYRRFVAEHEGEATAGPAHLPTLLTRSEGPGQTVGLAPRGVNAGNGFAFVSHLGEIYPSGFLPIAAGNVRRDSLAETYRRSSLFLQLRDADALKGRCGRCEYRFICGGSRSRAFALAGDHLETDPWCGYVPKAMRSDRTATHSSSPASPEVKACPERRGRSILA